MHLIEPKPKPVSEASYLMMNRARCCRKDSIGRDKRDGLTMISRTNARHIIISDCTKLERLILTCGQVYPLVIIWRVCVEGHICRDRMETLDIKDANRWICDMEILAVGWKENNVYTNLFMFIAHNLMVRVSRLKSQPTSFKQRSCWTFS